MKNVSKCRVLKILPRVLSVKHSILLFKCTIVEKVILRFFCFFFLFSTKIRVHMFKDRRVPKMLTDPFRPNVEVMAYYEE